MFYVLIIDYAVDNSCITNCQGMNAKVDISNVNDDIKQKPEVVQFLNDYESYKNGYHNPTNVPEDIKSTVWFSI